MESKVKEKYNETYLLNDIDKLILDDMYQLTDEQKQEVEDEINYNLSSYEYYYGYTEEEFYEAYGFKNREDFFNEIALSYKRGLYYEEYLAKLIPAEDIQNYYDQNVVGDIDSKHILVYVKDESKKEASLKLANNILKELEAGKNFDDVAKKYVEDYEDVVIFEELGYIPYDANIETPYVTAVRGLENGTYTAEPVETSYGYHIIYKKDQKEKPSLDEVKTEIASILAEESENVDENTYYKALMELREEKGLKIYDTKLKETYDKYCKKYTEQKETVAEETTDGQVVSNTITLE